VRRRKKEVATGWNARLAGVVLCAFFVLGMLTGFSASGRALLLRASALIASVERRLPLAPGSGRGAIDTVSAGIDLVRTQLGAQHAHADATARRNAPSGAIALVECRDGFYDLFADGALTGPLSPGRDADLPILSGAGVGSAHGSELLDDATVLVRTESRLSRTVSEMSVDADRVASLFFEGSRTVLTFDLDNAPLELDRAAAVLERWRGREHAIAAIDMTTAGEAIVRLQGVSTPVGKQQSSDKLARNDRSTGARGVSQ